LAKKSASFTHPETGKKIEYKNLDIALDYLQIIYQQPWRKLPIICLVSKENSTGKSTFGNFLRTHAGQQMSLLWAIQIYRMTLMHIGPAKMW
jgi:hypothetical protein